MSTGFPLDPTLTLFRPRGHPHSPCFSIYAFAFAPPFLRCMPTFMVYKDGSLQADGKLEGASPDALEQLVSKFA